MTWESASWGSVYLYGPNFNSNLFFLVVDGSNRRFCAILSSLEEKFKLQIWLKASSKYIFNYTDVVIRKETLNVIACCKTETCFTDRIKQAVRSQEVLLFALIVVVSFRLMSKWKKALRIVISFEMLSAVLIARVWITRTSIVISVVSILVFFVVEALIFISSLYSSLRGVGISGGSLRSY